jgi:hypothetical protein
VLGSVLDVINAVTVQLRQLCAVSLLVLGGVAFGCTDSSARRQHVSASLDRIDALIAKKEWEAARGELRRTLEKEISHLSGSAFTDAHNRTNTQAQLLISGMVEESRAELEKAHISVADLFAIFDADEVQASRSYTGKEVRVKGEVGMFATDQFDRPYMTLHSSTAKYPVQAILRRHDVSHERVLASDRANGVLHASATEGSGM